MIEYALPDNETVKGAVTSSRLSHRDNVSNAMKPSSEPQSINTEFPEKEGNQHRKTFFSSIRYHGSSSSIKCHVYHHVGVQKVHDVLSS